MKRTVLGFMVAPLWVPMAFAAALWLTGGQSGAIVQISWLSFVFGYAGACLLGVPAFAWLRARGLTAAWVNAIAGFALGGVVLYLVLVMVGLLLGAGVEQSLFGALVSFTTWGPWIIVCPVGSLVAITVWLIARPDRPAAAGY